MDYSFSPHHRASITFSPSDPRSPGGYRKGAAIRETTGIITRARREPRRVTNTILWMRNNASSRNGPVASEMKIETGQDREPCHHRLADLRLGFHHVLAREGEPGLEPGNLLRGGWGNGQFLFRLNPLEVRGGSVPPVKFRPGSELVDDPVDPSWYFPGRKIKRPRLPGIAVNSCMYLLSSVSNRDSQPWFT